MRGKITVENEKIYMEFKWFNRKGEQESQKIELNSLRGVDGEINEENVRVCMQAKYSCLLAKNREKWIYQTGEVDSLLERLHGSAMFLPVYLACMLGLSMNEVLELTWRDVDFEWNAITVKNGMSVRVVQMKPEIRDTLADYLSLQRNHYKIKSEDGTAASWHVCINEDGTPVEAENLSCVLQEVAEDEGLAPLAFDELRFSAAMMMTLYKYRVPEICGWLGQQNCWFETMPVACCQWVEGV